MEITQEAIDKYRAHNKLNEDICQYTLDAINKILDKHTSKQLKQYAHGLYSARNALKRQLEKYRKVWATITDEDIKIGYANDRVVHWLWWGKPASFDELLQCARTAQSAIAKWDHKLLKDVK